MRLTRRKRRIAIYVSVVLGLVLTYSIVYDVGMSVLENRPRSFLHSFSVVIETMTTTGYGSDAPWSHPFMIFLVVVIQLTGIASVFLTLELFQEQAIQRAVNVRPPRKASDSIEDHIIVCGYSEYTSYLLDELENDDEESVIIVEDEERAVKLEEKRGRNAVYGDPEKEEVLEAAGLERASHLVADVEDTRNTSVILAARDITDSARIVAIAEDQSRSEYYEYAGANTVITPRTLTGKSLAEKASTAIKYDIAEGTPLGNDIEILELPVQPNSELDGMSIRDASITEKTGVTVVGLWNDGELEMPPSPETVVTGRTVLVVAGTDEQFDNLQEYAIKPRTPTVYDSVVVAGAGASGSAAIEYLEANDVDTVSIDKDEAKDPDFVGDITDRDVLDSAGIRDAGGFIIAVSDDPDTLSSVLIARQLRSDIEIAVSTLSDEGVRKALQAGADYALSTPHVAGRLLAKELQGLKYIDPTTQIRISETQASRLAGRTLAEANVRAETGCTVIAIERDGETIVEVSPKTRIESGDELMIVGTDEEVHKFFDMFCEEDED